jgi:hypothetical protein
MIDKIIIGIKNKIADNIIMTSNNFRLSNIKSSMANDTRPSTDMMNKNKIPIAPIAEIKINTLINIFRLIF